VTEGVDSGDRARFCPFCGTPVGSFFGRHDAERATWCDRCEGWFRADRVDDEDAPEGIDQNAE
jgi:hypothetical protein